MMINLYLLLFAIASGLTLLVIVAGTEGQIGSLRVDTRTAVVLSIFTVVMWGFLAVSSFEITTHSGGTEFTKSYPSVAFLAVTGASVAFFVLFKGSVELLEADGGI